MGLLTAIGPLSIDMYLPAFPAKVFYFPLRSSRFLAPFACKIGESRRLVEETNDTYLPALRINLFTTSSGHFNLSRSYFMIIPPGLCISVSQ